MNIYYEMPVFSSKNRHDREHKLNINKKRLTQVIIKEIYRKIMLSIDDDDNINYS